MAALPFKWAGISGSFKRYVTPERGEGGWQTLLQTVMEIKGRGWGFSSAVMNADKIFYMANFRRNLPIGNYSLY